MSFEVTPSVWNSKNVTRSCPLFVDGFVTQERDSRPLYVRSEFPGSRSNVSVRLCAHLGPGFTLRSFLDGGHSFISVRTVLELENKGKGYQQQTFAARSCLLFASDIRCKKRKPGHCPSSRKRHLQYRMCPPSHAPFQSNSRQECANYSVDCVNPRTQHPSKCCPL